MTVTLDIPAEVRRKAQAQGALGEAWLQGLPRAVAQLGDAWGLTLQHVMTGGTEALVAACRTADGRDAVLKVSPPWSGTASAERAVLVAAEGRGYAAVLGDDPEHRALLLERLGPSLGELGWAQGARISTLCQALKSAWVHAAPPSGLINGAEKAQWLGEFIETTARDLGPGRSGAAVETALEWTEDRRRGFDPAQAVLAHGDPHAWNLLQAPEGGFRFVDPEGLFIEPAYDLGVVMRSWEPEHPGASMAEEAMGRCREIQAMTGVEAGAIWKWALIERVSTGLYCLQVGAPGADEMLAVAEEWAAAREL